MKFSVATIALFAGLGLAAVHPGGSPEHSDETTSAPAMPSETPEAEDYTTVEVTEYTTYCPKSTTLTHGTETIPVETVRSVPEDPKNQLTLFSPEWSPCLEARTPSLARS